jgi:hypothetical protein
MTFNTPWSLIEINEKDLFKCGKALMASGKCQLLPW